MNKFTYEKTVAGIAGVLFLISVGMYWLLYQYIDGLHAQLNTSRSELSLLVEQEGRHDSLKHMLDISEDDRDEILSYLLSIDNPTPFLSLVEGLAKDAGVIVSVESLTEEDRVNGGDTKETQEGSVVLRIALSVEGSWRGVHHLLYLFEHMPYIVILEKVALEEQENEGIVVWSGQVHMRVLAK